jgi:uncharacterized protein (DUF1697 family)
MSKGRHVALLRGINVGGRNIIKMTDLRRRFEDIGFTAVETYIQSGNVLFSAKRTNSFRLTKMIELALSDAFRYDSRVIVLSAGELAQVVAQAPHGFGKDGNRYRYDVLFVKDPLTTREALGQLTTKPGVDVAHAGDHALYFRRVISRAAQSHLSRLVQRPAYKYITIRNWSTTTKLLEMTLACSPGAGRG